MQIHVKRLRKWLLYGAAAIVVLVLGLYSIARWKIHSTTANLNKKLGVDVQQSTEGFTLSKSEAGRTLFTVRASKAVQYKTGGVAALHDVSITIYGKDGKRFDQIYGADFEYDPQSGDVRAQGVVNIDLQGNEQGGAVSDQSPPPEMKNPIHVKTSGLVFNQKTGFAATKELIQFRVPQASGSAIGATFDSKAG